MNGERRQQRISPETERLPINIVMLTPDDWRILRDLKLRSLEQEPVAFEDQEQGRKKYTQRTETEWRNILAGHMSGDREGDALMVFARDNARERYIGMVTAIVPAGQPADRRTATVQHMYVDSDGYRGKGVGRMLLESLLDKLRARGDIRRVELQVVETQLPAIQLYQTAGFKDHGRIPGGVQRGSKSFGELEMALEFPSLTDQNSSLS